MAGENNYKQAIQTAKADIGLLIGEVKKLETAVLESSKIIRDSLSTTFKGTSAAELNKTLQNTKKTLDSMTTSVQKQDRAMKAREAALKRQADLEYRFANQRTKAQEKEFQQLAKATQARNRAAAAEEKALKVKAKEAAAIEKQSGAYAKLLAQQQAAKKVLQNEIAARHQNTKGIKIAQMQYDKLSMKINQAAAATARSTSLMTVAVARLKSLAVAFGFFGTIFLIASTIKDAISRIRDFDKEMQNMAGVLRTTRGELAGLESRIKAVASVSTKTSNEVAKLATSLLVLGKSEEDVKKLLKPANDLGIALNSTSEAAGEFLVQQLNSFGASSDQAAKYADVIATVRTSTSLDFQKMRDSFQYLSPISRALGKDLSWTGSLIGILADNGLKAQKAGRLMGSSLQKLAAEGMTLTDALNKINDAKAEGIEKEELLAIATKLLGKESAKIGIILSNNSKLIELNAQKIRENGGALDDLVNQQMEAFDAKMKILDSSWEKWLLSLQAGKGAMGKLFLGVIEHATKFLDSLADINAEMWEFQEAGKIDGNIEMQKYLQEEMAKTGKSMKEVAAIEMKNTVRNLGIINRELNNLREKTKDTPTDSIWDWLGLGVVDQARAGIAENNMKQWAEAQAKGIEFMNVLREAQGLTREFDDSGARAFDETTASVEEFDGALKGIEIQLRELQEEILALDQTDPLFNKHHEALEQERQDLIKLSEAYYTLREAKKNEPWGTPGMMLGLGKTKEEIDLSKKKEFYVLKLKKAEEELAMVDMGDVDARKVALENIAIAKKELEFWETKNKTAKESKRIMEGSLDALGKIKSELEDERDRLATSTEAREIYNEKIKNTEEAIYKLIEAKEHLQEYKDDFGYDLSQEGTNAGTDFMATLPQGFGQRQTDEVEAERQKEEEKAEIWELFVKREEMMRLGAFDMVQDLNSRILEASKSLNEEELDQLSIRLDKEVEMFAAAAQAKKDLQEGLKEIFLEVGESILERRINDVDEEIDANKEKYAVMLDDENLSEEQRSAIEAERDRKEVELENKKKKREKENFLIQQGMALAMVAITLAQTLSAIGLAAAAQGAIPVIGPALAAQHLATYTPIAFQTAALSAGMILASTIPAFEKGTENAPEGVAMVDEKRPEVHTDKKGNVKSWGSQGGANLRYLEAGDKIYKSHDDFFRSHNDEDINRAVFNMNMSSQGAEISKHQTDNALRNEMRAIRNSNDMVWREVKKLANRPINNNVTVNVPDNSAY